MRSDRSVHSDGESGGHALLRGHERDIGAHPAAQRLQWRQVRLELLRQFHKLFHLVTVYRLEQGLAGREVPV